MTSKFLKTEIVDQIRGPGLESRFVLTFSNCESGQTKLFKSLALCGERIRDAIDPGQISSLHFPFKIKSRAGKHSNFDPQAENQNPRRA